VIGFILVVIFLIQSISGLILSSYYYNYYLIAFDALIYIINDINYGWLFRLIHILGSTLFMLFIYLHWLRSLWLIMKVSNYIINLSLIRVSGFLTLIVSLINGFSVIY